MTNIHYDSEHDEAQRREHLYAGDIYIYSPTPSSKKLCEFAGELARKAFDPWSPVEAQHHLPVEQYIEILKSLKPNFIHHEECKRLLPQMLAELGCDSDSTYFDVPRLRTACSGDYLSTGMAYAFKPHRDTWYSPPMSQINWWTPVFPICSENGMAFHPEYWDKPVRNDSIRFNYQDWNRVGRVQAKNQPASKDTRFQTAALDILELDQDVRLTCPPGGVIVFAAAHLHSTVRNTSGRTRFSIDFRTVDSRDIASNVGAPNVDSESTGTTLMDYMRASDLVHFDDAEIERYMHLQRTALFPNGLLLEEAH
ncbi:MAG: hypothetical protein ACE361_23660 [Aureliella sp.]